MDIYAEKQAVKQMKEGDFSKFLLLFDSNFEDLYKYVYRRVNDLSEAESIVKTTFLDALGQINNTPEDVNYAIWLYSLAKVRIWAFMEKTNLAGDRLEIETEEKKQKKEIERILGKLSLEEREILRLKFFEQVSDGDIMFILDMDEGLIGPKIYRVLKRIHFLLFGENEEKQGVYFGELSGFLSKTVEGEKIEVSSALKLNLRTEISIKLDKKDFAIEGEEEKVSEEEAGEVKKQSELKGSDDPAKVFVEAAREMKEEEELEKEKERIRFERREKISDFIDSWKNTLVFSCSVIFVCILSLVFLRFGFFDFEKTLDYKKLIPRFAQEKCEVEIVFEGGFSKKEKSLINERVSDRLCEHFLVKDLKITAFSNDKIGVEVVVVDWVLEYNFQKYINDWRIKKYYRTFVSDQKYGKIPRNA